MRSIRLLFSILLPSTHLSLACEDSTTYLIETQKNGFPRSRHCSWLTALPAKATFRVNKFCNKSSSGSLVKDNCKVSCNNCPTPVTSAPSPSPVSAPVSGSCVNSSTYKFVTYKGTRAISRHCTWLTQSPENKTKRTTKFCSQTHNGSLVKDECQLACNTCSVPNQPTSAPSSKPSTAESATCVDSTTYTFYSYAGSTALVRRCPWLTNLPLVDRASKFCSGTHNGSLVKDQCRKSCNNC